MRISFPYLKEQSRIFGVVTRPIARVILQRKYPQWMYVDSGADISLIPLSVGRLIGLTRTREDRLQRIFGISRSSVSIIVKKISMRIGSSEFNARVAWSQVEEVPLLLGRMDVFPRFSVTFKERNQLTTFSTS
jgi:predicted aspartyl protease